MTDFEIIILDDASTDQSRAIIESYRGNQKVTQIVYNSTNSGSPFRQWKKGIELAKGDWIWIAESDDISSSSFLQRAAEAIQAHPEAAIFYCDSIIRNESTTDEPFSFIKNKLFKTNKWANDYCNHGANELAEALSIRCTINNASAAVMRKDILLPCLDQLAGYRFHGDWFCYLYLLRASSIYYHAQPLNTYRSYSSKVRELFPGNGWNRLECFRILNFQLDHLPIKNKQSLTREFAQLYLEPGIWKGRKEWAAFFRINKRLTWKIFRQLLRRKLTGQPVITKE